MNKHLPKLLRVEHVEVTGLYRRQTCSEPKPMNRYGAASVKRVYKQSTVAQRGVFLFFYEDDANKNR